MAEIVGLVLGVAALAGTFKDCIELMSCVSTARSAGLDYEILNTKLDVERTLFLRWAERVRLLQIDYDYRLDDPSTQKTIMKVLASVHLMFSQSSALQEQYGLQEPRSGEDVAVGTKSQDLMQRFTQAFEELSLRVYKGQRKVSWSRRVRWVAHDKERFETLIRELSDFISALDKLIPAQEDPKISACQSRILQSLWFREIDDREDSLDPAHRKTLLWGLSPPHTDGEWDDLSEWLRSGSGAYWLSGKAGSGKSTLMKHLYHHGMTEALLQNWSQTEKLIRAKFFFWYAGTAEQKSHRGLMQTLLYQILESDRSLIPKLLSKVWREAWVSLEDCGSSGAWASLEPRGLAGSHRLAPPSLVDIKKAFDELSQPRKNARKLCLFIDGSDECSGSYQDGISFINSLVASTNIKVLVSSRPESEFVAAFTKLPKLRMQDLTKDDIKLYVMDNLGSHTYVSALKRADLNGITEYLVDKADGIFLWVILACRSLLSGFAAHDRASELWQRVLELPKKLEEMFAHMLSRIDKRYQDQTAKLLQACFQAYLIPGDYPIPTLGLAILEEHEMDLVGVSLLGDIQHDEKKANCLILEGRLRSRCGGLLELRLAKGKQPEMCFCGENQHDSLIDSKIVFIHRTVVDFLKTDNAWSLNCLQIQDDTYDPAAALSCLWLYLAQVKKIPGCLDTQLDDCVTRCFWYGTFADKAMACSMEPVLVKLGEFLEQAKDSTICHYANIMSKKAGANSKSFSAFLVIVAVETGMLNCLRSYQVSQNVNLATWSERFPLLYHGINRPFLKGLVGSNAISNLPASLEMIKHLFLSDCRADETFFDLNNSQTTPWEAWIDELRFNKELTSAQKVIITTYYLAAGINRDHLTSRSIDMEQTRRLFVQELVDFPVYYNKKRRLEDVMIKEKGQEIIITLFGE